MKKHIPNAVTAARFPMALGLLMTTPLSLYFLLLYALCGLSDVLDGYLARKLDVSSNFGAKLDTAADLLLTIVLVVKLLPVINPSIAILGWLGVIAIIRGAAVVIMYLKFKTASLLHTYGNKLTGVLLFALPFLLMAVPANTAVIGICLVATVSAVEELAINCFSKTLDLNRKSLIVY